MATRKEGVRVGIFGASGSGKTTHARRLIDKCGRLVIFDPKYEWAENARRWTPGAVIVRDMAGFKRELARRWVVGFKIIYAPPFGGEVAALDALCRYLYQVQLKTKSAAITILIDEAQQGVPAGTSRKFPAHGALVCAVMGRSRGVNMVVCSQRITTVDINLRANLSHYCIFRLAELNDIRAAAEIVHDKETLLKMPNYAYFYKSPAGEIKFFSK